MYKFLFVIVTVFMLVACAGTSREDDLSNMAEEKYNEASVLVTKAQAYKLNIGEAENQLAQAGIFIEEEKFSESIVSSEEASRLALNAIELYEKAEAYKAQQLEAANRAEEAERLKLATNKYTVQSGDTLWSIAANSRALNHDALLWPLIYKENQSIIDDPDLIYKNMVLAITATTQSEQIQKARHHAQNRGYWRVGVQEESDKKYLQQ